MEASLVVAEPAPTPHVANTPPPPPVSTRNTGGQKAITGSQKAIPGPGRPGTGQHAAIDPTEPNPTGDTKPSADESGGGFFSRLRKKFTK